MFIEIEATWLCTVPRSNVSWDSLLRQVPKINSSFMILTRNACMSIRIEKSRINYCDSTSQESSNKMLFKCCEHIYMSLMHWWFLKKVIKMDYTSENYSIQRKISSLTLTLCSVLSIALSSVLRSIISVETPWEIICSLRWRRSSWTLKRIKMTPKWNN